MSRKRRWRKIRSSCLLLVLAAGAAGMSGEPRAGPDLPALSTSPSVSGQVLAELRAANEARAERLREEEAWALEKEKLELLAAAIRSEVARLRAAAEEARSEEADLRERTAGLRAKEDRHARIEEMLDTLSEVLEKALEELAGRSLPGLVPPDRAAAITEPAERFAAAVRRLEAAERQVRTSGIELVEGLLEGRATTVRLLRIGGVAAWWATLDEKQAGVAVRKNGELNLFPPGSSEDIEVIRRAFAIAEGRAAPDWVLLPVAGVGLEQVK
jgi:hypothetical protein